MSEQQPQSFSRIRKATDDKTIRVEGKVVRSVQVQERTVAVRALFEMAEPLPAADYATVHSGDGLYRASIPLDRLLSAEIREGRLHVPDAPTNCWNVKDVMLLEVTTGKQSDTLPT